MGRIAEEKIQEIAAQLKLNMAQFEKDRKDPLLMEQAVLNLVDNAVKYASSGKELSVKLEREKTGWIGMPVVRIRSAGMPRSAMRHVTSSWAAK